MLSLIIIKRTKDLVKTGMCKINEAPCQLQLEARRFIFFVLQGEWNGCVYSTDWFIVNFQSFSYSSIQTKSCTSEESHSVGFVCRDRRCSGFLSVRPLYRQNSIH